MRTTVFLALRGLRFRKRQTALAVMGVFVGVLAMTTIISVSNGFEKGLVNQILDTTGHLQIWSKSHQIYRYRKVCGEVAKAPGVIANAPCVLAQGIVEYEEAFTGVRLKGIEPSQERTLYDFQRYMKKGRFGFTHERQVLLGQPLAEKLGTKIGNRIRLIVPGKEDPPQLLVIGLFKTGVREYDHEMVFVPIALAQKVLGYGDTVSHIFVKTDDPIRVRSLAQRLRKTLNLEVTTWLDYNRTLLEALSLEKRALFVIILLTLLVASFGIGNLLTMMVYEKIHDIGMMRAMGLGARGVRSVFVVKGLVIGVIGALTGIIGGLVVGTMLQHVTIPLPSDIYYVNRVPVDFQLTDFVLIGLLACAVASFAGFFPARKAAAIEPYQAIRHLH